MKWVGWTLLVASALGMSILYVYDDKNVEAKNTPSHEKKIAMRILEHDEYVRWAEHKIDRLNETIAMAENTRGKVEAYDLFLFQEGAERDYEWGGIESNGITAMELTTTKRVSKRSQSTHTTKHQLFLLRRGVQHAVRHSTKE